MLWIRHVPEAVKHAASQKNASAFFLSFFFKLLDASILRQSQLVESFRQEVIDIKTCRSGWLHTLHFIRVLYFTLKRERGARK